jgi:formate--tetrahydrofolate ligase
VKKGVVNLLRHIENARHFGVPAVVAINHFTADTDAEVQVIMDPVAGAGSEAIVCRHWAEGGAGTEELANKVVEIVESGA